MTKSKIEWTDRVWNPITGCTKVSDGCKNCYAETIANRFWGDREFSDIRFHKDRLKQPYTWKKPSMVFVGSMTDMFHEDIYGEHITDILNVIKDNPQHTFQILTKRAEMLELYWYELESINNIWLGVSVENQKAANERIPKLLEIQAAVRFVSCEPLLERVNLGMISYKKGGFGEVEFRAIPGLDWVIVGGESGSQARLMSLDWARNIRDQCKEANIPFFFKQLGTHHMKTTLNLRGKGNTYDHIPLDLQIREYLDYE